MNPTAAQLSALIRRYPALLANLFAPLDAARVAL